jgi:hypothetical protein
MTIKNGDLPAMPITVTDAYCNFVNKVGDAAKNASGLTKREQFAAMAMQGLMTRDGINSERLARIAITAADALLAELERTK